MSGAARLILASASPRRRELLASLGLTFEVVPSDADETLEPIALPEAVAALALRKARAVAATRRGGLIVAADTIVVIDGRALGKPADRAEARAMLQTLRGRTHEVMTGVVVLDAASGRHATETVISRVTMAAYSDAAIDAYVAGGEPLDKAGAYGIQGRAGRFISRIEGCYFNVVGLPLARLQQALNELGWSED